MPSSCSPCRSSTRRWPAPTVNPKKIYCVDHALARSVGSGILVNAGHLLENLVFTALRRSTPEIRYFKGANGHEVDFVAGMPDGSRMLVQVCESLAEPRTRKREVRALDRAMAELGLRARTIVTRSDEENHSGRRGQHRRSAGVALSPRQRVMPRAWSRRAARRRCGAGGLPVCSLEFGHERSERVDACLGKRVVDRCAQAPDRAVTLEAAQTRGLGFVDEPGLERPASPGGTRRSSASGRPRSATPR